MILMKTAPTTAKHPELPQVLQLGPYGEPHNLSRAHGAAKAIYTFMRVTRCDEEDALTDLLCDLMHWARFRRFDFAFEFRRAEGNFAAELHDEKLDTQNSSNR